MAEAAVRTLSVTATIAGREVKVSDLEVSNRVGEVATIRVTGAVPKDATATQSSADVPLGEFAAQAGELQKTVMTTARLDPDFLVKASDGQGAALDFKGYLSAPGFSVGYGSVDKTYAGVHVAALLGFYRGEVFNNTGFGLAFDGTSKRYYDPQTWTPFDGSVANQLRAQLEKATKLLKTIGAKNFNANDAYRTIGFAMQAVNDKVYGSVISFLKASAESSKIPGFDKFPDRLDFAIRNQLWREVTAEGGLLNVLTSTIPAEFGLQFVCRLSSSPAARLELLSYTNAKPIPVTIPAENLSFVSGGQFALPVKAVVVRAARQVDAWTTSLSVKTSHQFPTAAAVYPGEGSISPGSRVVVLDAPAWFNNSGVPLLGDTRTNRAPGSIEAYLKKIPKNKELVANLNTETQKLLTWWAQNKFAYLSLMDSQASVRMPLNFGMEVGRVYSVRVYSSDGSSEEIFQGYLQAVTHRISCKDGGGDASTNASFSHVQAKGYVRAGARPSVIGLTPDGIGIGNLNPAGGALGFNSSAGGLGLG
jgi:hypothetical protein